MTENPDNLQKRGDWNGVLTCGPFEVQHTKTEIGRDYYRLRTADWVCVIPITPAQDILLVQQWRQGAELYTLELPGGQAGTGEKPANAAVRELREETGYRPGTITKLGMLLPNPALQNNRMHVYMAKDCTPAGGIENDPGEHTELVKAGVRKVPEMIRTGRIQHALMAAALALWQNHTQGREI